MVTPPGQGRRWGGGPRTDPRYTPQSGDRPPDDPPGGRLELDWGCRRNE